MTTIAPENLLHRLGPYLPTDRFRALLSGQDLAEKTQGAAMIVDISGFTPLTVRLVEEYGPQRASEELKRRLNPMFEAIAGQVFTHGGSVLRFVGDGFTAWFPDTLPHSDHLVPQLPGVIRACVAGVEMLEMMAFFRELDLKVAISPGKAQRWVVGDPQLGLVDVLTGEAVETVAEVSARYQKHETRVDGSALEALKEYPHINYKTLDDGDLLLSRVGGVLVEQSRAYRWSAWQAQGDIEAILTKVQQFIDPIILEQEVAGLGGLAGELRYATPLFLRFKGLDYNNDPTAKQNLDQYLRDVQRILQDTRGRLVSLEVADKGSIIFAVFGAPIAHGDDSQRAVHAALAFRDLPRNHPYISAQNIGISRGLLYSGTVGGEARHEYTSLGDETNVASRLMSADHKGIILASQAVFEETGEWFDYTEEESITAKGKVGQIRTFVPRRVKRQLKRNLRRTPLVGREKELDRFHKAIAAVKENKPRILRLEGEAGIGKSRLAAELMHLAASDGHLVATGYCLSTGGSEAFLPWRPIIRSLVNIDEEWNEAQEIIHLSRWIEQNNDSWMPRLPLLGDLMGLAIPDNPTTRSLAGSARQQALFALVIEIIYFRASKTPLTIIIEDTHWIDEVSEALAIELTGRLMIEPVGILFAMLHRNQQEAKHPPALLKALAELYIHQHLPLNELSVAAVDQMLVDRLGGIIPPELVRFVYEKSQGNPFFVQEVVDALQESNSITRVGPKVYIDANLDETDMPQTVQGLIQARIDNLSESEKIILKIASVIGRTFEMRVLYQALPLEMSAETFMQHLRTLERRKFSQLETLYPEPLYTFRHAITQEVAYQTLLYDQRRQLHRSVGIVLEALQPQSWERLAYHFTRGDDEERAYIYLVRAGDKTAREFANQAALDYWAQAVQLTRTPKEQFDLLCKRLELLLRTSQKDAAMQDLEKLTKLAASVPDNTNWKLRSLRFLAEYELDTGDIAQGKQVAEDAAELANSYNDPNLAWEINSILLRVYTMLNIGENKQEIVSRLRNLAAELNEPAKALQLSLNDLLGLAEQMPETARTALEALYPQIMELSDPILEASYWDIMSRISMDSRNLTYALDGLRTLLSLWRQIGNRRMEGYTLNNLGRVMYWLGDYSGASGQIGNAYKILKQVGDLRGESTSLAYLGLIAFRRDAYGEATAYISRALAQQREINAIGRAARSLDFLGQVELAQGNFENAHTHFVEAGKLFRQDNTPENLLQIHIGVIYARVKMGDMPPLDEARPIFSALPDSRPNQFHDIDLSMWQANELVKLYDQNPQPVQVFFRRYVEQQIKTLIGEARTTFLNVGYTPDLLKQS